MLVRTFIDLFAGCGGISLGLHNAGWKGHFALEKSDMAFETLKHNLIDRLGQFNWAPWLPINEHDINEVLSKHKNDLQKLNGAVDLVVGSPPCQGFSLAGRRIECDHRNDLVNSYIEFIKNVKPAALFFENVKGFTIGFKKESYRSEACSVKVAKELKALGYKLKDDIIDSSLMGIPQRRKRYILVGMLSGNPDEFFIRLKEQKSAFLKNKGLQEETTTGQAISDLERIHGETTGETQSFKEGLYGKAESPYQKVMRKNSGPRPDSHRFANHKAKTVEKFTYILNNCSRGTCIPEKVKKKFHLKKKTIIPLDKDSQCPTLTTLPDDYIHYSEPRILTVREYARIQSFPDWFEFKSNFTTGSVRRKTEVPRYTQVGNAVPPLFAELAGAVLRTMI